MDRRNFAPVPALDTELVQELSLGGLRVTESWHKASQRIALHAHRRATVTVLLDGSWEESYKFRSNIACQAPAVHVRPPGEPHRDQIGNTGAHNLVLEISDARLDAVREYSTLFDDVQHLENVALVEITRRLRRELKINDQASKLAFEGLAMELLATASRGTSLSKLGPAPWLRRVYEQLNDTFLGERPSLDALAETAGVHPVHLARAFRKAYGCSPGEYLRQRRVDWAAEQLKNTEHAIADIAIDAGFSDQSHFSRIFRAAYGMPPGAWRRGHTAD